MGQSQLRSPLQGEAIGDNLQPPVVNPVVRHEVQVPDHHVGVSCGIPAVLGHRRIGELQTCTFEGSGASNTTIRENTKRNTKRGKMGARFFIWRKN